MVAHLGKKGEDIAKDYLYKHGYTIIEKNWRTQHKEIDLIATIGDIIVFIEVKTRSGTYFGRPAEAVGIKKKNLLMQAAEIYIETYKIEKESRFDIIEIILDNRKAHIEHITDAFSGFMH